MTGWAASAAFTRLVEALEASGSRVTGSGRQRSATCPAHDDSRPSLSVTDGMERVLVRCHSGCDVDDLLLALGLARADLFDAPRERPQGDDWTPWRHRCPCQPVARYPYVDESGRLLYEVIRGAHKEFAQRRPDPSSRSGWRWSLGDVRRVLFRLPAVLGAPDSAVIWLTEGEKDVLALEAVGEIATTGGAAGKWRTEFAQALAGRDLLIVADRDKPGREHAQQVHESLEGVARYAWIVEAATGKDAADHLAAGFDASDFVWWTE